MSPGVLNHFCPGVENFFDSHDLLTNVVSGDSLKRKGHKLNNETVSQCQVIPGDAFSEEHQQCVKLLSEHLRKIHGEKMPH